jgi:hypothetical protein
MRNAAAQPFGVRPAQVTVNDKDEGNLYFRICPRVLRGLSESIGCPNEQAKTLTGGETKKNALFFRFAHRPDSDVNRK